MTKAPGGVTRTQVCVQPTSRAACVLRRPVVLIGLMGAGKSSVGLRLANTLGVPFVDSDHEIERAANKKIPEIFADHGETYFRDGERRVIKRLLGGKIGVVATGGGAFMDEATRALIARCAVSVWLRATLDVLIDRTAGRTSRPLLNAGNPREILAELIDKRYPIYAEADVVVDSRLGQTHEDMAARIIDALVRHGGAIGGSA